MMHRILEAVGQVYQLPDDENPVKKVLLVVSWNKGKIYLDKLEGNNGGGRGGNQGCKWERVAAGHLFADGIT
jgi:hypothetical protein